MTTTETITAIEKMMSDECEQVKGYHGCLTGDCPHENQLSCSQDLIEYSHEAATRKLLTIVEAALSMAEFYGDGNNWIEIDGTDGCLEQIKNDSYKHDNGYSLGGKRARAFQALVAEMISAGNNPETKAGDE